MNDTTAITPIPMNKGTSSLAEVEGANHETHERLRWLERQIAAVRAVMERKVAPRELRVLWQVLEWSFGLRRETTRPFTGRDLALRTGMTPAGASRALKGLKEKHIIRKNADGSLQFMPESKFHPWLVPRFVDEEQERLAARRVDDAQGMAGSCQLSAVSYQPDQGSKQGDQKSEIGVWSMAEKQNGDQPMKGETNMKEQDADDHGAHEPHGNEAKGGDGVFLPTDVTNLAKPAADAPLKSSPPSHMTPFNTINLLKGESVANLTTTPETSPVEDNGTEAGMEKGCAIPEDPSASDEETLMRRLVALLGQDAMKGRTGARLRLFIRGSLDADNSPDTAVAMRKAINETEAAVREGRIKKSVFGYLWTKAFEFAALKGWKFDAATKSWMKGKPFNLWKRRKALMKSVAA